MLSWEYVLLQGGLSFFFVISSEVFIFVLGWPASGNAEITPLAKDIVGHVGVNLLNI